MNHAARCHVLGFEVLAFCECSHATNCRCTSEVEADSPRLRATERLSQRLFRWREWKVRHLSQWGHWGRLVVTRPLHYPRKQARAARAVD